MITLTPSEQFILRALRDMKPYERIEITKDKDGKPDRYLVHREQKILVSEIKIGAIQ